MPTLPLSGPVRTTTLRDQAWALAWNLARLHRGKRVDQPRYAVASCGDAPGWAGRVDGEVHAAEVDAARPTVVSRRMRGSCGPNGFGFLVAQVLACLVGGT